MFLLLFPLVTLGQSTFVKQIDGTNFSKNVRVFQTNDQGIAVFSLDSLKLYKFNSCGNPEWAKQYKIPIGPYIGSITQNRNGGFALLNRVPNGPSLYHSVVTVLDANGAVVWSKSLEDPNYIQFPYTISEDGNGDFVILANAAPLNQQGYFNALIKLDANGSFIFSKFFNIGPIWGGAIVTSDGGILMRIGSHFMKTDVGGNQEWASNFSNTTSYLAPIEVSDGYIFTGQNSTATTIHLYKMDKAGLLQFGSRKITDFTGTPPQFYKKSNGNIAAVFNKSVSGLNYTTIMEFDKDLNIVHQSTLDNMKAGIILQGSHVGFSDENHTLLAGLTIANAAGSKLFFAKTNNLFRTGCDTTFTNTFTTEPVTQLSPQNTNVTGYTFSLVNKPIPVKNIPAVTTTFCSSSAPAKINIGQDSILCANTPLALRDRSGMALASYRWSTGDTTAIIAVTQPGKYWLRATTSCGTQTLSDTVVVTRIAFPQPALTPDTALCQKGEVLINATLPGAVYRWQDGSTNAMYHATKPGKYEVDVTYQTCTKRFSVKIGDYEKLLLPNIFTPNNDDRNETFRPMEMCGVASGKLKIYNRWGQLIYETSEITKGWNGKVNGQKSADGVYYYLVEYSDFKNQPKKKKGWVELVGS